jgi:hypothetical protein
MRRRLIFILVATSALILPFFPSQAASAHTVDKTVGKPGVCEVGVSSGHTTPNKMWGITEKHVSSYGPCYAVRVCIYWSWDSGYQSWGSKCANAYTMADAVVEKKDLGNVYARYSLHFAIQGFCTTCSFVQMAQIWH